MYIHRAIAISPQQTFGTVDLEQLLPPRNQVLYALEPDYSGLDRNHARRMSKAVKMAVTAASMMSDDMRGGIQHIVFGTGSAGNESSMKFLQQMSRYADGQLTPGDFIQSTPNSVAGQIATVHQADGYNMTHVHGGLSFENAMMDALMLLDEYPERELVVGAVDEQSDYGYRLNVRAGWYLDNRPEETAASAKSSQGTVAGEACCLFRFSAHPDQALVRVRGIAFFESEDPVEVKERLKVFIEHHSGPENSAYALLSGQTPEARAIPFYEAMASLVPDTVPIYQYKHLCGEFPTATAFGVWLVCYKASGGLWPSHMLRSATGVNIGSQVLLINTHKAFQHSFCWLEMKG